MGAEGICQIVDYRRNGPYKVEGKAGHSPWGIMILMSCLHGLMESVRNKEVNKKQQAAFTAFLLFIDSCVFLFGYLSWRSYYFLVGT
ncbi:hypothetical protein ADH70_016635 [Blautia pseudococcoides]|uniref:Uncharacterized protein n=1 Tax=Blautia pseudococcoides TaxID=1796616 RepID=A0A1C7IEY5_9FIRM|nr:hypothetical protein A4V09_18085 [Blautia pseudococcoides]ASU30287.1 hypothetical protein ADH70_016635 [Blautia pseudococcoides]